MIITQTPLRISFFGGGTDFRQYFLQEGGAVITSAIDRCVFVVVKKRFDDRIRVGYTKTELVDDLDELQHELVRECLRKTGVRSGVEISTLADIPSAGSGIGSSSTVTVGLLNALYVFLGQPRTLETLAREACEIEIDVLKKPIGVQDQYIAAYGGQKFLSFGTSGSVEVESISLDEKSKRTLNRNLMLFFTKVTRKAETVLSEQVARIDERIDVLRQLKDLAFEARSALNCGECDDFGRLLHQGWELKKKMADRITNGSIDSIYEAARKAGALGGKITGAGGGGFLLLYCPVESQEAVRSALEGYPELPFQLEQDGTKVILNYRR